MSSPSEMGAPHVAVTAGSHLGSPPLPVLVNFRHFSIFSKRRHGEVGSLNTPEGWCHCHVNVKYPPLPYSCFKSLVLDLWDSFEGYGAIRKCTQAVAVGHYRWAFAG